MKKTESPFIIEGTPLQYLASVRAFLKRDIPYEVTFQEKLSVLGLTLPESHHIYPNGREELLIQTSPDGYSPEKDTALVVIAHPDDEAFVGGLIHKLRQANKQVIVISVSDGGASTAVATDRIIQHRRDEMREAMKRLDVNLYINLGFPDGEVEGQRRVAIQQLVQYMRIFDPQVVIGHSRIDYHSDHIASQNSLSAAYIALYQAKNANHVANGIPITNSSPAYYEMDTQGSKTRNGRLTDVDFVVKLDADTVLTKLDSFAAHKSQVFDHPTDRDTTHIQQLFIDTRRRGRYAGTTWGEGLFDFSFGDEAFTKRNILAEWLGKREVISIPQNRVRRKFMEARGFLAGMRRLIS